MRLSSIDLTDNFPRDLSRHMMVKIDKKILKQKWEIIKMSRNGVILKCQSRIVNLFFCCCWKMISDFCCYFYFVEFWYRKRHTGEPVGSREVTSLRYRQHMETKFSDYKLSNCLPIKKYLSAGLFLVGFLKFLRT